MPTQRPAASSIQAALWSHPLPELLSGCSEDFSNLSNQELRLWQQLEGEIQYLNQLAADQEAALLQLMAMVEQLQARDRTNAASVADEPLKRQVFGEGGQRGVTEVLQVAQQLLEGIGGAIVLLGTATGDRIHALRSNASKSNGSKISGRINTPIKNPTNHQTAPSTRRSIGLRRWAVSPTDRSSDSELQLEDSELDPLKTSPTLQEAFTLTLGAAVLRIVLDRIVQFYPALWFIAVLLMIVPAAVAIYRTHRLPRSGFLWGCRLTLILVGLLLGGRM